MGKEFEKEQIQVKKEKKKKKKTESNQNPINKSHTKTEQIIIVIYIKRMTFQVSEENMYHTLNSIVTMWDSYLKNKKVGYNLIFSNKIKFY